MCIRDSVTTARRDDAERQIVGQDRSEDRLYRSVSADDDERVGATFGGLVRELRTVLTGGADVNLVTHAASAKNGGGGAEGAFSRAMARRRVRDDGEATDGVRALTARGH